MTDLSMTDRSPPRRVGVMPWLQDLLALAALAGFGWSALLWLKMAGEVFGT